MVPMRNSSDGYPFSFTATKYVRNGHRGLNLSWSVWKGPNGMGQPKYVRHGHRGLSLSWCIWKGPNGMGQPNIFGTERVIVLAFDRVQLNLLEQTSSRRVASFPCVAREQIVVVWVVNDFQ